MFWVSMKDFFISYNRHDKQWAEWIAWTLEEAGYTVVIQAWDFRPGGNFALDMNKAVTETQATIAVLSETFLRSDYTAPEWAAAFARDPKSLGRKLIPVRVGECQPTGLLAQIVYVDLVGVTAPSAAKALVLGALQERAKPAQEPGFPGAVTPKAERVEPEPVAFPGGGKPTAVAQSKLSTFEFEVVTVSLEKQTLEKPRGPLGLLGSTSEVRVNVKLTSRRGQAQYFTEDLGNGVGLEMVSLPGGAFVMGAPKTEAESRDNERPQHLVRLQPFFMGKFSVTQEQWFAVSELPKVNHDLDPNCSYFKGLKRPVEQVSWWQAVEFCDRLSRKTGREYRLPSESEWEYACRAGTTTPFHFGETLTPELANYDTEAIYNSSPTSKARREASGGGSSHAHDWGPANGQGLYDMHGNVWEWCLDQWYSNYQGAPKDGSAWVTGGESRLRVLRGGSWVNDPAYCRSAFRLNSLPGGRDYNIGFRVGCASAWTL